MVFPEAGFGPADQGGDYLDMDELGVVLIREMFSYFWIEFEELLFLFRSPRYIGYSLDPDVDLLFIGEADLYPGILLDFSDLSALTVSRTPEPQSIHYHDRHRPNPGLPVHAGGEVSIAGVADYFFYPLYAHNYLPSSDDY